MVFSGFVTACRFARTPTNRFPSLVNATTEGVVFCPSSLGITLGATFHNCYYRVGCSKSIPITLRILFPFNVQINHYIILYSFLKYVKNSAHIILVWLTQLSSKDLYEMCLQEDIWVAYDGAVFSEMYP